MSGKLNAQNKSPRVFFHAINPRLQLLKPGSLSTVPVVHVLHTYRVADLPSLESEQEQRRQELTAYLHHLKQKSPDKEQAGTAFGAEFYSLVQRLSQERKTTYESIRGLHCWHTEQLFLRVAC